MPGKTEHVLFCRLSQRQRAMYEAYIKSNDVVRLVRGNTGQLFGAITMLRKISNHPDLVCDPSESSLQAFLQNGGNNIQPTDDDEGSDFDDEDYIADEESLMQRSGKLEVLSKVLPLWHKQGHRVLIFCQWKKMLNIIQRFTMLKGWKFARLDGNTNIASRQRLVDTFNSDESYFGMLVRVANFPMRDNRSQTLTFCAPSSRFSCDFQCTTRTGGVGLNLTGTYVRDFLPIWKTKVSGHNLLLCLLADCSIQGTTILTCSVIYIYIYVLLASPRSKSHPYLRSRFQPLSRRTSTRTIVEVRAGTLARKRQNRAIIFPEKFSHSFLSLHRRKR